MVPVTEALSFLSLWIGDDGLRKLWDLCCRDYTSIVFGPEFTIYSVNYLYFCPPIIFAVWNETVRFCIYI